MRKREFLLELEDRLKGIDITEKRNILNYYDELISDKVESGQDEERIIRNLGSIEEICRKLNLDSENLNRIKYESIIDEEISKSSERTDSVKFNKENKPQEKKIRNKDKTILTVILIIVLFPIWLPIVMSFFGLLVGAFSAVLGFMVAGFAISIAGIYEIIISIPMMSTNLYSGIFNLGGGLIILAIGFILTPIMLKVGFALIKYLAKAIGFIFKKLGGK